MKEKVYETEDQLQAAAIMFISQQYPQLRGKVFHPKNENFIPPNEGESKEKHQERVMRTIARFKALGLLPGVPDICIRYRGVFWAIELKLPNGRVSEEQEGLHDVWFLDSRIARVFLCRSLIEVQKCCDYIVKSKIYAVDFGTELGRKNIHELLNKFTS